MSVEEECPNCFGDGVMPLGAPCLNRGGAGVLVVRSAAEKAARTGEGGDGGRGRRGAMGEAATIPEGREPWMIGRLTADPNVCHGSVVCAGTRIPASTVWSWHRHGHTPEQIAGEYPSLTEADVEAALRYEVQRRAQETYVECPACGEELTGFPAWARRLEAVESRVAALGQPDAPRGGGE